MSEETFDRGSLRRARLRRIMGGPGSIRRWLAGSLVLAIIASVFFAHADLLGRIALFILVAVLIGTGFRARSLLIGDEDELRAGMRRDKREASRSHQQPDQDKILLDDDEWERLQELLRMRDLGISDVRWPPGPDITSQPEPGERSDEPPRRGRDDHEQE